MNIACIVLASGTGKRFNSSKSKLFYNVYGTPIIEFTLKNISNYIEKKSIYITISKKVTKNEIKLISKYTSNKLIYGGKTRLESLQKAVSFIEDKSYDFLMIHDGARPNIPDTVFQKLIKNSKSNIYDCLLPYEFVNDTLRKSLVTVNRDVYKTFQTPQIFKFNLIKKNIKKKHTHITDDFGIIERQKNLKIKLIESSNENLKITRISDISLFKKLLMQNILYGNGFDIHKLKSGTHLSLAGLKIKSKYMSIGHSDGDVVLHSIIDALLGATNKGDIGEYFPNVPKYKNISSITLLENIKKEIQLNKCIINKLDCTIICQKIRLTKYKKLINESLAVLLNCNKRKINIKAKTADKIGLIGKSKAIACWTTIKLIKI